MAGEGPSRDPHNGSHVVPALRMSLNHRGSKLLHCESDKLAVQEIDYVRSTNKSIVDKRRKYKTLLDSRLEDMEEMRG